MPIKYIIDDDATNKQRKHINYQLILILWNPAAHEDNLLSSLYFSFYFYYYYFGNTKYFSRMLVLVFYFFIETQLLLTHTKATKPLCLVNFN